MYSQRQRAPLWIFVNGHTREAGKQGRTLATSEKGLTTTATKNPVEQQLPVMTVDEPYDRRSRRLGPSEVP